MKNKIIIYVYVGLFTIICISCNTLSKKQEGTKDFTKAIKWSEQEISEFLENFKGTDYERHVMANIIAEAKYEVAYEVFMDTLDTEDFKMEFQRKRDYLNTSYIIDISKIATKSKKEVASILGEPFKKETVNPSNTPCPCDKLIYLRGIVEVVYMNGKADWITVYNTPNFVKIPDEYKYRSVSKFDDYVYVKATTR